MRHGREVNDDVGLDRRENAAQGMIIASVLRMQRDTGLAQEIQPLVDDTQVQIAQRPVAST